MSEGVVDILGVPVDRLTFAQALERIARMIRSGERGYVVTANPEIIMRARRDPAYRKILQEAAMVWPDGVGVLWASRLLGAPIPERVTGSDGVPLIAQRAAAEGWRLYLLGAGPGVAERAARVLEERYPGVQIVGAEPGDPRPEYDALARDRINAARPDILFVAYGAPKQEWWMARNVPHLEVHVAIGVGGALDFLV
ncbi:MAG: WecB/TagA/CpsF family glycosyltransferase, partial [Chloroflexi bacterium]|nr:WecB/TagA/CpsF family glycosyltransferase [Chloroflexota bacterium]